MFASAHHRYARRRYKLPMRIGHYFLVGSVAVRKHSAMKMMHKIDKSGPIDAIVPPNVALIEEGGRGDQAMEPYAVYLLGRYRAGESLEQLVVAEGIPRKRIIMRLRVAAKHVQAQERTLRAVPRQLPSERAA